MSDQNDKKELEYLRRWQRDAVKNLQEINTWYAKNGNLRDEPLWRRGLRILLLRVTGSEAERMD